MTVPRAERKHYGKIAISGLTFPSKNVSLLLRMGLGPGLAAFLSSYIVLFFFWPGVGSTLTTKSQAFAVSTIMLFSKAAYMSAAVIYMVRVHRFIISGEEPGVGVICLRDEVIAYGKLIVVLSAVFHLWEIIFDGLPRGGLRGGVSAGFLAPTEGQMVLAGMITQLFLIWGTFRLALMLPHAALTGDLDPRLSWDATQSGPSRIIGYVYSHFQDLKQIERDDWAWSGVVVLGSPILGWVIASMAKSGVHLQFLVYGALLPVRGLYLGALAAILSYAYMHCIEKRDWTEA